MPGAVTARLAVAIDDPDALSEAFDGDGLDGWAWATAGIVMLATLIVAIGARWLLARLLCKKLDMAIALLIARATSYVIFVTGLAYALAELGVRIGPLIGALGIAGIALAFALKDILENFVAGVMLQIRRPFTYGDEVEINEREGRVRDIDARLVTIVTPDGETLLVPSAVVIKSEVVNYTAQGGRRTDVPIGVAYGSDLADSKRALRQAVDSVDGVRRDPPPTVLLTGFGDSSIDFVVRYRHDPSIAAFWRVRSDVTFAIDRELTDAGITIPFPQRTLWFGDGDTSAPLSGRAASERATAAGAP